MISRNDMSSIVINHEYETRHRRKVLEDYTTAELKEEILLRENPEQEAVENPKTKPHFLKLYDDADSDVYDSLFKIEEYNDDGTPSYITHTHGTWNAHVDITNNLVMPTVGFMEDRTYGKIEKIDYYSLRDEHIKMMEDDDMEVTDQFYTEFEAYYS